MTILTKVDPKRSIFKLIFSLQGIIGYRGTEDAKERREDPVKRMEGSDPGVKKDRSVLGGRIS